MYIHMSLVADRLSGPKKMISMRLNLTLVDAVKKLLKAKDRTEAVERALAEVAEKERFHRYIEKTSGRLKLPGLP